MSKEIRKYKHIDKWYEESEDLILTAIVGGEEYGSSIQFTIGNNYAVLSSNQLLDLISTISKRLGCREGFTASGITELKTILFDGESIIEKELLR